MDAFEEPFPLEEEPPDTHQQEEDEIPADMDVPPVDGARAEGEPAAAAAERDSMYVSLFEGTHKAHSLQSGNILAEEG